MGDKEGALKTSEGFGPEWTVALWQRPEKLEEDVCDGMAGIVEVQVGTVVAGRRENEDRLEVIGRLT